MSFLYKNIIFFFLILFLLALGYNTHAQLSKSDKNILKEHLNNASDFAKKGETNKAANFYYKAGYLCLEKNAFKKAIPYLKESGKLYLLIKRYPEVQKTYSNLGLIHTALGEYDRALLFFNKSLKIREFIGKTESISSGMVDIAYVLGLQKKNRDAILMLVNALDKATEVNHTRLILTCYKMLADYYGKLGNLQKAGEYSDKYSSYSEHYGKIETKKRKEEEDIQNLLELSKKDAETRARELEIALMKERQDAAADSFRRIDAAREDSLQLADTRSARDSMQIENLNKQAELRQKEIAEEKIRQKNQLIIIYSAITLLILVVIIVIVLLRSIKKSREHRKLLEESNVEIAAQKNNVEAKNIELTSAFSKIEEQNINISTSIQYARNIQKAILPQQTNLNNYIKDSFIFFEPRDKVSGDFFWFQESQYMNGTGKQHKKFFISAIDCTGHGVPGALLSMVSYNILDSIVVQKQIHSPDIILNELHASIRKTFRQKDTDNRDGMDMALCTYDEDKNIVEFSGAKNPVIFFKEKKIYRIKGNVKPIGGTYHQSTEDQGFDKHVIKIDSPTTFYIFSDGFADQMNGKTGKKFMTKRFREMLSQIHEKPMENQKRILGNVLTKWKGDAEQVDDVLVIGFKINPGEKEESYAANDFSEIGIRYSVIGNRYSVIGNRYSGIDSWGLHI